MGRSLEQLENLDRDRGAGGRWSRLFVISSLVGLTALAPGPVMAAESALDLESLEREVRTTEATFARTMAERDHSAFVSFLAPEVVFVGREVLRGRDAVAAGWAPYFEEPEAPFSWAPDRVVVTGDGALALSSGPVRAPDGTRVGTFNSVWRRQGDGSWKIVLDGGCPQCADD